MEDRETKRKGVGFILSFDRKRFHPSKNVFLLYLVVKLFFGLSQDRMFALTVYYVKQECSFAITVPSGEHSLQHLTPAIPQNIRKSISLISSHLCSNITLSDRRFLSTLSK